MTGPTLIITSARGVGDAIKRLGVTLKKSLRHPKADEAARQRFRERIEAHEDAGKSIVYIDESGFAHDMPRTHGYAPRGKRCYGVHDWGAKRRTNVIGALLGALRLTTGVFQTTINTNVMHRWLTEDLLPKLPPGSVLVMDNASFHKPARIRQAIETAGHALEFLPSYSPDLNPIEPRWAQAKARRRRTGEEIHHLFSPQD